MPRYTALVTLLTIAFYFFLATRVAAAHGKFNVKLPAMAGNPDFERVVRAHVKYARVDADVSGAAVAVCNLPERYHGGIARPRVDCRTSIVLKWLQRGR